MGRSGKLNLCDNHSHSTPNPDPNPYPNPNSNSNPNPNPKIPKLKLSMIVWQLNSAGGLFGTQINGKTVRSSGVLSQVVTFELMRGAVKKDGVGLGWGSRGKRCQSTEQEER